MTTTQPRTGTGNRTTRVLGAGALVASAGVLYFGLHATPPTWCRASWCA